MSLARRGTKSVVWSKKGAHGRSARELWLERLRVQCIGPPSVGNGASGVRLGPDDKNTERMWKRRRGDKP